MQLWGPRYQVYVVAAEDFAVFSLGRLPEDAKGLRRAEEKAVVLRDHLREAVRFLEEPTSRTYIITYLAGRKLSRTYVGGDPARFRRLLTEQVRVGELLATSLDSTTPP